MAAQNPHFITSTNWSAIVNAMYPDILTSTYSVPPMYFNQVAYRREIIQGTGLPALVLHKPSVAGDSAPSHNLAQASLQPMPSPPHLHWSPEPQAQAVPKRVLQTDVSDDTAQAQVLRNLQVLGESRKEAMFIISQLNFSEYLHDPAYAAAVAQLPGVPADLKTGRKLRGDFDVLVIHRQYGILLGELKTVGKNPAYRTDAIVSKTIQKALKQLEKSKSVMSSLVKDVASSGLTIRTTLFLPFVRQNQLQRVLTSNPQLEQDACFVLGAADAAEATQFCCCADQLSDPVEWWEMTPTVLAQLDAWWQHRMNSIDPNLTDNIYLDVVARFVGPATSVTVHCSTGPRVQVKTVDQALSELGQRLTTLVLTPEQVDLMQRLSTLPLVYLSGPPGTGKTVTLTLVGLYWMRQGEDVYVVSGADCSRAASRLVKNQLEATLAADPTSPPGCGRVFLCDYNLNEETEKDKAVKDLAAKGPDLCIIYDELTNPGNVQSPVPRYFLDLLSELRAQVTHLRLWAAGCLQKVTLPAVHQETLLTPLRSAPAILRELEVAFAHPFWSGNILQYNTTGFPTPGDGLRVEQLVHEDKDRNGHTGNEPEKCFLCGQNVATVLHSLGVGVPGSHVSLRDVFVLSFGTTRLKTSITDDANNVTTSECDLILALRNAGLAVYVITDIEEDRATWEKETGEMAEAMWDAIVATDSTTVQGMERKIVVLLSDRPEFMIYAGSRATTQLVVVSCEVSSSLSPCSFSPSDDSHSDADSSSTERSSTDHSDTDHSDSDSVDAHHSYIHLSDNDDSDIDHSENTPVTTSNTATTPK